VTNISNFIPLGQVAEAGQAVGDGAKKGLDTAAGAVSGVGNFFGGITESMAPMLGEFLPKLIGALVFLVVGYIIARIVKAIVTAVIGKTGVGDKLAPYLGSSTTGGGDGLASGLGTGAFWIVMMFVGIGVLQALDLDSVSEPLTGLLNDFSAFVPNIIGAAVLFGVAFLVATVVKIGSGKALQAADVDTRLKLEPGTLTNTLPLAGFSFILLFFLPGVLDALGIESLSAPVKDLVAKIMAFLPTLLSAGILLAIFLFVAKLASTLISSLLTGVGFNDMPQKMGLNVSNLSMSPSDIAGKVAFTVIGLMGAIQAVDILQLETLSSFVKETGAFVIPIVIGCAILGVGLWLANMAKKMIKGSNMANSEMMANVAFGAIMVLTGVISLKKMGLAGSIVDLGFGLALGGMALALALAFGLGGRDAAAKFLDKRVK